MAEAIIGPLVGTLQEIAVGQARAVLGVNDDIQRLRDKLMWLQAFLREADTRRRAVSDEVTKVWQLQTRDAVFDADDALDHFHLQVAKSRYPRWARPTLRFLAAFTTEIRMRRNLSRKIKAINSRLEEIIANKEKYTMEDPYKKIDVTWRPSTSTFHIHRKLDELHDPNAVIYVEAHQNLEEALVTQIEQEDSTEHHPMVISLHGESGIGKMTLVRDIYNKMFKMNGFDVQAMDSFAPYLSATNILQQLVQQLTDDNENCPKYRVKDMLEAKLREKRYLLVIDGEVSGTEWKNILTTIPLGKRGSRVVHITQFKPEEPPSNFPHKTIHLKKLEKEDTMALFLKRLVLMDVQHKDLVEYHKGIYEITQGLPLAIVLLSGLVQTKEFPGEWMKVFEYLRSKQSTNRLETILSVCFDDLPHELKSCILYFAALPTNTTIEARNLVCMWVAEGFLRPKGGKSMEKIGYIYLNELIHRNLVNPVKTNDDSSFGNMFVTIQNKVHDFLQIEAHEASFVEVHSGDDIPTLTSSRRLSLQNYTDKYAVLAHPLPKLRSIFSQFEQDPKADHMSKRKKKNIFHHLPQQRATYKKKNIRSHLKELFHGSEFLRVINLQGIEIGEKLTTAIGNVVHLQYLGITSCSLKHIPSSIGRLTSLQTLDVRETNVRELPRAFWMIKTLRHVFGFVLKLPNKIGNLKQLHTLDSIDLKESEQVLDGTLGEMIHLEYLFIWHVSSSNMMALSSALETLESLRTLILHGAKIPSSIFTNFSLRRLKFLFLNGQLCLLPEFSTTSMHLPNLIMLSLEKTQVTQQFITKLVDLPSLSTLVLHPCSYNGKSLAFSSSRFPRLSNIKIIDVETLETVEIDVSMLRKLKKLEIHSHKINHHHEIEVDENITNIMVDLKKENTAAVTIWKKLDI
ncbi:hypothetical protein ACP4OV_019275 [Aristida adscensionis]